MSNDQPPPEKPTVQLARPTDRELLEKLLADTGKSTAAMGRVEANMGLLKTEFQKAQSDISGLKRDIGDIQDWKQQVQGVFVPRLDTHSIKVQKLDEAQRQTSSHDSEQDTELANQIMKATAFEGRLDSFERTLTTNTAITADLQKTQTAQTQMITTIYQSVMGVFNNPKAKFVWGVVWKGALLLYAYLEARQHLPGLP